jgi:hypothetical protein
VQQLQEPQNAQAREALVAHLVTLCIEECYQE